MKELKGRTTGPLVNAFNEDPGRRNQVTANLGRKVFTTFVSHPHPEKGFVLFRFEDHLERLLQSAEALGLIYDAADFRSRLSREVHALAASLQGGAHIYRIVFGGDEVSIFSERYTRTWPDIISLASVPIERGFPEYKTTSAVVSVHARTEANKRGAQEALLIDRDGFVREGAWSNVFWVENGEILTPKLRLLPGITRKFVLQNFLVKER